MDVVQSLSAVVRVSTLDQDSLENKPSSGRRQQRDLSTGFGLTLICNHFYFDRKSSKKQKFQRGWGFRVDFMKFMLTIVSVLSFENQPQDN